MAAKDSYGKIRPLKKMSKEEVEANMWLQSGAFSKSEFWTSCDGLIVLWHAQAAHIAWVARINETSRAWEKATAAEQEAAYRAVESTENYKFPTLRSLIKALEKGKAPQSQSIRPLRTTKSRHNKDGGWRSACGRFYFYRERVQNPAGKHLPLLETGYWKMGVEGVGMQRAEMGQWPVPKEKQELAHKILQTWRDRLESENLTGPAKTRDELVCGLEEYLKTHPSLFEES